MFEIYTHMIFMVEIMKHSLMRLYRYYHYTTEDLKPHPKGCLFQIIGVIAV